MRISIVGGGNIGTLLGAEFAFQGHEVTMYTSKPERWSHQLQVFALNDELLIESTVANITADIAKAVVDQDYIFVTLPSHVQLEFAKKAAPYVKKGTKFVIVPGYGGSEFLMNPLIAKGASLIGFQRVHAIARLVKYGHSVCMRGRKPSIRLAVLNYAGEVSALQTDMEGLFALPVEVLPNYLAVTLTPSNPILHTSRLYTMFKEYKPGMVYPHNIPFYDSWTDDSSKALMAMDDEEQMLCKSLPGIDLKDVHSLRHHYESPTVVAMTHKLSHIDSFHGIMSPMIEIENGWIPDFNSRYFSCDFEFGLEFLCQFTDMARVEAPVMHRVMNWYREVTGNRHPKVSISDYGILTKEDIYTYYKN